MITQKQVKDYIESDGAFCPFCNSSDIYGIDFDAETANKTVRCADCGEIWHEQYQLVDVYQDGLHEG